MISTILMLCSSLKRIYRPISLCNVLYKLVSKAISNRLKLITDSESKSAFVPGRLITDNALVAYELFHYYRKKKRRAKGFIAMKHDMSKAYDRVEWEFIRRMILQLGFDTKKKNNITAQGLRQGDRISPFLLLLCAEGFSALLRDVKSQELRLADTSLLFLKSFLQMTVCCLHELVIMKWRLLLISLCLMKQRLVKK